MPVKNLKNRGTNMILPQDKLPCKKTVRVGKVLEDRTKKGRSVQWRMGKQFNLFLGEAHEDIRNQRKAERVKYCCSYLWFLECQESEKHPKKLKSAVFCEDRLCGLCQKRKSIKQFAISVQLGHEFLKQYPTYRFLFLTLTVPNVKLEELRNKITHILESWNRLIQRTEVKRAVKGYYRTLEITYNHERKDYHPHLHVVLVVSSAYFKTKIYIKRDRWLEMWRESTRQQEITQVDIRSIKVRGSKKKTIDPVILVFAEACKYGLKPWSTSLKSPIRLQKGKISRDVEGHAWLRPTRKETASVVDLLESALYRRRLVQYGGILKQIKRELKIKDAEERETDLINLTGRQMSCKCSICNGEMSEVLYVWNNMLANYYED